MTGSMKKMVEQQASEQKKIGTTLSEMKIELDYLSKKINRHGTVYYYYRRNGKYIRILDENKNQPKLGTREFLLAYQAIGDQYIVSAPAKREGHPRGSLGALMEEFKESDEFRQLSKSSKSDYLRYMKKLEDSKAVKYQVSTLPRSFCYKFRDEYKSKPRSANYAWSVLRRILGFGVERGYRKDNPASNPKQLKTGDGHFPWEEIEIDSFRDKWPLGTWERTGFELLLNTGQRGSDVAKMVRTQYYKGTISVRQDKTKAYVQIPAQDDLTEALTPWLRDHEHIALFTNKKKLKGKAVSVDTFQKNMRSAVKEAGLKGTLHGLRYTAATRVFELTKNWDLVSSITGHETVKMAQKYATQKKRARTAVEHLNTIRRNFKDT